MTDHQDIVIIGAGVVGLSIAKHLSEAGRDVLVLEKETTFGMGISSRNSEVIHAGLYFSPDMLKTKLCVTGKEMLYDYSLKRHIPHQRCGKIIIASSEEEVAKLEAIKIKAELNGVLDTYRVSNQQIAEMEPEVTALEGLVSPSSGIIDSHMLMVSILGDLEDHGGMVAYGVDLNSIEKTSTGLKLIMSDGYSLNCNLLINAAGLGAQRIAHKIDAMDKSLIPELVMAKGHYFSYSGKANFKHLIYPLPNKGSLGLHLSFNMAGAVKFGPDINFVEVEEYDVPEELKEKFVTSTKRYFPKLDPDKLHADYAGIRPKLSKEGLDFNIQLSDTHGIDGLINLFGMESPGLTSSLAIGKYVKDKIL